MLMPNVADFDPKYRQKKRPKILLATLGKSINIEKVPKTAVTALMETLKVDEVPIKDPSFARNNPRS